jgi:hypothetical protein
MRPASSTAARRAIADARAGLLALAHPIAAPA